jgi:exodeoxyribonuclease VIII
MPGTIYHRGTYDYDAIDGVGITTVKAIAKSPLHYQHLLKGGRKLTRSLELGSAGHIAVLEPERFLREFALWDEVDKAGKTKARRGPAWEAFKSANTGKTPIRRDEYGLAISVKDAIRSDRVAMKYLGFGKPEVAIQWTEPTTGIVCRSRLDWLTDIEGGPCLVDIKGTRDVTPRWFSSDCAKFSYHLQMAFYRDAVFAATGRVPRVVVVAVEMAPPHDVVTYIVPDDVIEIGRADYLVLLERLKECRARNEWPGVGNGAEQVLALPAWAVPDDDDTSDLGLTGWKESA